MKKNILLLLSTIILLLILTETVLNFIGYRSTSLMDKDESDFIVYNREVNYVYRPNQDFRINNENYNVGIQTNSYGYRDGEWTFQNGITFLVVGDSYSAGFGVETHERFSDLLKNNLRNLKQKIAVYNAAVSGYNLIQMNKTILKWIPKITPNAVLLGLTIGDLERIEDPYVYYHGFSLKKSKVPFARIEDGHLLITHFRSNILQNIETFFLRYSKLYQFLIIKLIEIKAFYFTAKIEENNLLLSKTKKIISTLADTLKMRGTQLLILPIIQNDKNGNINFEIKRRYNDLKNFFNSKNIEMVDILLRFEDELESGVSFWIKNDPHWNKAAHQLAADLLTDNINKMNYNLY